MDIFGAELDPHRAGPTVGGRGPATARASADPTTRSAELQRRSSSRVRDDLGRHGRDPAQHRRRAGARPAEGAQGRARQLRLPAPLGPAGDGCERPVRSGRVISRDWSLGADRADRRHDLVQRPRSDHHTSTISQPRRRAARLRTASARWAAGVACHSQALALDADAVLDVCQVELGEQTAGGRAYRVLVDQGDAELGQAGDARRWNQLRGSRRSTRSATSSSSIEGPSRPRRRHFVASWTNHCGDLPRRSALSSAFAAASRPSSAAMPMRTAGMRSAGTPSTRWMSFAEWPRQTWYVASVAASGAVAFGDVEVVVAR